MKAVGLVLSAVFVLTACETYDPAPPATNTTEQPIVNGTREPETVALTPAQIRAIGWLFPAGDPGTPFCTATLVAPDLIVTAAHCSWGASAGDVGFGVGQDPSAPDATFDISAVYINRETDAAMMLLASDATAGVVDIEPIRINDQPLDDSLVGKAVQAGGFGDTYNAETDGRWFATVYVDEITEEEVIVDGAGEQGICFGDSGSGLIDIDGDSNPIVLAVESYGDASCVDIDHLARLDVIYDWIGPILDGEVPEDPCDGLGREGRCVDNVVEWCPRGELRTTDCTPLGTECVYFDEDDRHGCACGEIDEVGWCDGDVLEYCRDGRVRQWNCGYMGATCGWDPEEEGYSCVEEANCLPEDEAGRCEGNTAIWCVDGHMTREICYADDGVCVEIDDGVACDYPVASEGGGATEDDSDAGGFPDVGNDATINQAEPVVAPESDECGGCSATESNTGTWSGLLILGLVAAFVRRRG